MKKKNKKKTRKRSRKIRKRKKHKLRKKVKHIQITKKTKKSRKIKKKYRKSGKRKKLKRRKKVKRIKITKKTKSLRTSKQLAQLKKLTVKKVLSLILQPFVKLYEDFKEKRKLKKLKQINFERKEKERQIKAEERLRKKMKEYEFQDEVRIARMRSHDLKRFIREEQAILRREQVNKRRRFLEDLKLEKKIELFRKRELEQIMQEEREDYRPVLERLEKIKEKYRLIREQKIRERVKSLGLEVLDADTKEDLLQKQKAYEEHRQKIELVLESFYRSANSLVFQLNKRYIPKHKSILRVIDRRYEENLCFIRYDDNSDDDWLILIYLEDSNPAKETIIVEDKTNPEKHVTKSFQTRDIFAYSDYLVDQMTSHIDRERQKKAS